jgi:hypothetical protein
VKTTATTSVWVLAVLPSVPAFFVEKSYLMLAELGFKLVHCGLMIVLMTWC